jgi:hypothetical protein
MIPMLSSMSSRNRVVTHSDEDGCYLIVMKPGAGLIAAFGLTLLSDESWPVEDGASDDLKSTQPYILSTQRRKTRDPLVFAELKKIEEMARKHKVPTESILLVDCTNECWTPDEVAVFAREALEKKVDFARIRSNGLWPKLSNRVGLALTDVLVDEVWGLSREEYCERF